ncbi:UDP-N-acetylmuramate dehydrogenase [Occallatibacter riparius]|uniref:UDP-N-acetylenolpyruvoylglucosamine reductase n=1 Tax=Occallatibacter riparius TaxID=1002689 RepID=A0A9J7BPD8_9BACT|nr:UDP-N-acetylmuramate dehydrogenase [Occallatibacter riparius]UWZ82997.1 UDP-N-acetylmuramate dehydrogenase [Occallatibacter riparius]
MRIEESKILAPFTTFGIGGPARWFVEAQSEADILEATAWADERKVPLFVLGGGSNVLIADAGFNGLVIHIAIKGIEEQDVRDDRVLVRAAAGEEWSELVQRAVEEDCAGIECLAGIPGTAGGTPVQNVGAYGQEVSSVITRVRTLDLKERRMCEFDAEQCGFSYRRSRFNTTDAGRFVVTRVDYQLVRDGAPTLKYPDLQHAFPAGSAPSLVEVAKEVCRIRASKAMVLADCEPDCCSAGSFFKNPIISEDLANRIEFKTRTAPPRFVAGAGRVKIPAAWLIEQAGFQRGFSIGNAGISTKHTLALVNRGGATASEILALAAEIRSTVEKKFGVVLQPEPVFVGF